METQVQPYLPQATLPQPVMDLFSTTTRVL